jgi:hypothetical protein
MSSKVKTKKLKSSELAELKARTEGKSEREKTLKAIGKEGKEKDKSKKKKAIDKNVDEVLRVIDKANKKKDKDKSNKEVKKDKSNKKAVSTKQVKETIKEMDMPKVLNTRHVTMLVEELTDFSLGIDTTAGSKNLRRYLRSMPAYNDDVMTSYSWSIKDDDDLEELAGIISHYAGKVSKQA